MCDEIRGANSRQPLNPRRICVASRDTRPVGRNSGALWITADRWLAVASGGQHLPTVEYGAGRVALAGRREAESTVVFRCGQQSSVSNVSAASEYLADPCRRCWQDALASESKAVLRAGVRGFLSMINAVEAVPDTGPR